MNCEKAREFLDLNFDLGENIPDSAMQHIQSCTACITYQTSLAALDCQLRTIPEFSQDPVLVARIQASIASQSMPNNSIWTIYGGVAAAVLLVLAAGWYVDVGLMVATATAMQWVPEWSGYPDWAMVREGVAGAPAAMIETTLQAANALSETWAQGSARLIALIGGSSAWIWAFFAATLLGAAVLNASEALAQNDRRIRR